MNNVASIVLPNGMDEEEGTSKWKNEGNRYRQTLLPLLTRPIYLCGHSLALSIKLLCNCSQAHCCLLFSHMMMFKLNLPSVQNFSILLIFAKS